MINTNHGVCQIEGSDVEVMIDLTVIIHALDRGLSNIYGKDEAKNRIDKCVESAFECRDFPSDEEIKAKKTASAKEDLEDKLEEALKKVEELATALMKEAKEDGCTE